jgi:hypothetical protein
MSPASRKLEQTQMDVQAPVCVFCSIENGEGGVAGIPIAFAVPPVAVQASGGLDRGAAAAR